MVCHGHGHREGTCFLQFPAEAWRAWAGVPGGSGAWAWLTVMTNWALSTGGGEGSPSSRLLLSPCGIRGGGILNYEELEV